MPGKLLVKRLSLPTASEGGILLPGTPPLNEALVRGIVLAVGDPAKSEVKVDDVVVFPYRAGEEFKVDGHAVLLMKDADIRAIETAAA